MLVSMLRSDAGCGFGGGASSELAFSMSGSAQIRYSGEAIAKVGRKIAAIEQSTRVVVASQRDVLVTPEETPTTTVATMD